LVEPDRIILANYNRPEEEENKQKQERFCPLSKQECTTLSKQVPIVHYYSLLLKTLLYLQPGFSRNY
jgi:hypothetical protein